MRTYTQIIYQIVFGTKHRENTLHKPNREALFKYISGILGNSNCHLYIINGVDDHLHILTHLHPAISLSSLVKDIKLASSKYIKENKLFADFNGWQEGYGAFTYSFNQKENLINYIKNQEAHHRIKSFREEYMDFLNEHEIQFEEKYLL